MYFDSDQQQIVNHETGPLLVVAGAGSGKTATIIGRAVALIKKGVEPSRHLMLTFSRKAADEMRKRMAEEVDLKTLAGMVLSTFHSFGYQLLRERPSLCGRRQGVTVMDERDVRRLLKEISNAMDFQMDMEADAGKVLMKKLQSIYSLAVNELLDPSDSRHGNALEMLLERQGIHNRQHRSIFFALFSEYSKYKERLNLADFDDLLCLPVRGLRTPLGESWARSLQERFSLITVDEGQDTNRAQYALLEIIGAHGNVVLVGDDDQAIYSWRGASASNMPDFVRRMKAKVALLPRNYRSTASIIEQAAKHVARNKKRFEKNAYAVKHGGMPISYVSAQDSWDGARQLANKISCSIKSGVPPAEIAVLYRVNRLARTMEYALREQGIRYRVVGGISLESRKEVRMCIAVARLVVNRCDFSALETFAEALPGMGKVGLAKIRTSLMNGAQGVFKASAELPSKARAAMQKLEATTDFLASTGGVEALVGLVASPNGLDLLNWLGVKDSADQQKERRNNIELLHKLIRDWVIQSRGTGVEFGFEQLIERLLGAEMSDDAKEQTVVLSSIHKAKGLEWEEVHVFGYSEGLMPLSQKKHSAEEDEDSLGEEEERRLSYVAITRAKRSCTLWHCQEYDFGYETCRYPRSRFIDEMKLQCRTL